MARIRSIKPEFPQSESIGRLSRDARLLFILLWTIVDDEGRARAASRMLASLLYPYDDDAPVLIEGWLSELEKEGCICRYEVDGSRYLEIAKWLKHQKIDKPSRSKLPAFVDGSRMVAKPREASAPDLGPRIRDLGEGRTEAVASAAKAAPVPAVFIDATDELWQQGPIELISLGVAEKQTRGLIGKWRKDARDDAVVVMAAIRKASALRISNPIPWITQAVQQTPQGRPPPALKKGPATIFDEAFTESRRDADHHPTDLYPAEPLRPESRRSGGPVLEQDRNGSWLDARDDFRQARAFGR